MVPTLTNLDELKHVLAKYDVSPSKAMGQNFLVSAEVVEAAAAILKEGPAQVTELGPGLGTLTQALAASGLTIKAIEKDDEFVRIIPDVIPKNVRGNVEVVHTDLKEADWAWGTGEFQLAGNIPYNLSGYIFRKLTQLEPAPAQALFLIQKEVAERIAAGPPNMSLLSLAIQLWGKAERLLTVPPNCFWPQPKVHSQLVFLQAKVPNELSVADRERIISIAKPFFQNKRKQIGGTLRRTWQLTDQQVETILKQAGITPSARPEEVSAAEWQKLASELAPF